MGLNVFAMRLALPVRLPVTVLVASLALVACGVRSPAVPMAPPAVVASGPYRVQPGDVLEVKFLYHATENQRVAITPDGRLPLGVTGDIDTAGLTVEQLEDAIKVRASRYLRDPVVNVTISESGARAYIGGEVSNSGFVSLSKPMTVLQAILERGGFTPGADLSKVMVISKTEGQPAVRELNVASAVSGNPLDGAVLAPDDVVFVPKTGIAQANAFVDHWIDGLTPQIFKNIRVSPLPLP
jgi:polysaccharide export outer membrane protein